MVACHPNTQGEHNHLYREVSMKRGYHLGRSLASTSALAFMLLSAPAFAQDADNNNSGTPGSENSAASADVGEIIVTANKREQSANKVGLAITALSADVLKDQKVTTLSDLAAVVPGLSYTPSATQSPVYTLRGVGFYESTLAAYPTTSIYVDQVPLPFPAMTTHANFDLERVEILKGPQGTLFGQNSTGGAINFIAAKPTDEAQMGGDLTYGRFNRLEGNLYVSGPLSSTLKARLALTGGRADNWQHGYTRTDTATGTSYYGGRLILDWEPTPELSAVLTLTGWRDESDPQIPQYQTLLSQAPAFTAPELRAYPFAPDNARAADWGPNPRAPHADNRLLQPTLNLTWNVSDGIAITSLTSYSDYKQESGVETDGTTLDVDDFFLVNGRIKSFSQELRISNTGSARFRWVIGGNYEKSHVTEQNYNSFTQISTTYIFGYTGTRNSTDQHMRNLAAFANVEYDLTDQLTVKLGGRYTDARRRATTCSRDPGDNSMNPVFEDLSQAIQNGFVPVAGFTPTGLTVPPIGDGCFQLDNITTDGTPATYLPSPFNGRLNENNVSWRVGLDYKATNLLLFYANVAKGYKAGSFPVISGATMEQYAGVTQEALLSYEAGFKLTSSDRRLQVNAAGFYYDYSNKQLRAKTLDALFGVLDKLVNVPKSRIIGAELDATWRPIDGLVIGLSGSVLDSKVTDYIGLNTAGQPIDLRGSAIPYTPKYQGRVSVDYSWRAGHVEPFVGAVISARSSASANIGGSSVIVVTPDFASSRPLQDTYKIDGYTLVDLRAGVKLDDGKWSISVFGKNVFNKFYLTNIFTDYDTVGRFTGQPATYGITISAKLP